MSWAWLPATGTFRARQGWGKLSNCEVKLDGADALAFRLLQPVPRLDGGVAGPALAGRGDLGARQFGRLHHGARLQAAGTTWDHWLSAGARSTGGAHLRSRR